jgi:5-methylcytosine-specific restriction endonuclease McrA
MVWNPDEDLGDRLLPEDPPPVHDPERGAVLHGPERPDRTATDLIAERDDAALRYFLRRTRNKIQPGERITPRLCTYCGSSGIVVSKKIGDTRVLTSKLQDVQENKEILCLHCHRVWTVTLIGWE